MDGSDIAAVKIKSVLTVRRFVMKRDSGQEKSTKASAKVEPERVGRMHGRREPSVCSQLFRQWEASIDAPKCAAEAAPARPAEVASAWW